MKQSLQTIRLTERVKNQFIQIKRKTGIDHWNVISRWAFLNSLALPITAAEKTNSSTTGSFSNVEMTWKVFAGDYSLIYASLLSFQAHISFKGDVVVCLQFHLERGAELMQSADSKGVNWP